ncbi:Gp49 family protein [Sphingomonas sp. GV3]|uniref:Gp49 family protein n=1 Tax=Sphingomonas sp. GV3 TaxID=3040671 RepID=UPI00280BD2BD|nr:Gp49 family protein [Sphingomonas sp. GV3]
MTGLEATEAECAAGRTAPRVSLDDIKANITCAAYITGDRLVSYAEATGTSGGVLSPSLNVLTVCLLVLRNGFTIIGKSAPADARNFDPELGQKLAYEDAVRQIWPLMGYALRDRLRVADEAVVEPAADMTRHIGTKVINAKPMTRQEYNDLRGWTLPADEDGSDAGYLVEYADGQRPNVSGYDGYVSWSPADVFERAYAPA